MRIRVARHEDRDAVLGLWEQTGLGPTTEAEWRAISAGDCARLLVAEDEGAVLGAAIAAYDGWRAFIYHVAVAADKRRRGIASSLIQEAETDLKRRGAQRVFALLPPSNADGLALASAHGYEPEGDMALVKSLP